MSVRDTITLNRKDLRYLLIDSLRLYSDNVAFIDGNNPYRFSINNKTYYVLIKNVHESGNNRSNEDECRIQVSKTKNFNAALNSNYDVIVLGYFADEKVFTAWNPYIMRDRFNQKQTISLYSRFSIQKQANRDSIAAYRDSNNQSIVSFKPNYLGLYLENLKSIHFLSVEDLKELVYESDNLNIQDSDGGFKSSGGELTITHSRQRRDPKFRTKIHSAYNYRCAMCGIGLEIIEAAHIIPHSHEKGTDDVNNGISLCSLHHSAFDRSLIYINEEMEILINNYKIKYLEKIGQDSGIYKFIKLSFDKLQLPKNQTLHPNIENIRIANQIRGISN